MARRPLVVRTLNAALAPAAGYLAAQTAIAIWVATRHRRSTDLVPTDPRTRMAVLIPAHNEAPSIGSTLEALHALDYPNELFEVYVVADNCDDDTADVVRSAGFQVFERHRPDLPGKGPALNWLLAQLDERQVDYDAVVFIDADTTVSPGLLAAIDQRFAAGAQVIQGNYGVRDPFASTPSTLRYCALAARHHLRPMARAWVGGSCGLFGNGMAFTRDMIARREWTDHLVEDMEFQLELLLADTIVEYEPRARIEAEMPNTFRNSVTQHQRWETGRLSLVRRFAPRLVSRIARPAPTPRMAFVDGLADLTLPPLSMVALGGAASAGLGAAAPLFDRRFKGSWRGGLVVMAVVAAHALVALRLVSAPSRAYRALLHAPRLACWKLWVLAGATRRRGEWIRTARNLSEVGS